MLGQFLAMYWPGLGQVQVCQAVFSHVLARLRPGLGIPGLLLARYQPCISLILAELYSPQLACTAFSWPVHPPSRHVQPTRPLADLYSLQLACTAHQQARTAPSRPVRPLAGLYNSQLACRMPPQAPSWSVIAPQLASTAHWQACATPQLACTPLAYLYCPPALGPQLAQLTCTAPSWPVQPTSRSVLPPLESLAAPQPACTTSLADLYSSQHVYCPLVPQLACTVPLAGLYSPLGPWLDNLFSPIAGLYSPQPVCTAHQLLACIYETTRFPPKETTHYACVNFHQMGIDHINLQVIDICTANKWCQHRIH